MTPGLRDEGNGEKRGEGWWGVGGGIAGERNRGRERERERGGWRNAQPEERTREHSRELVRAGCFRERIPVYEGLIEGKREIQRERERETNEG